MKKLFAWLMSAALALMPQVANADVIEFNLTEAFDNRDMTGYFYNYDPNDETKGKFFIETNGLLPSIGAPRTLSRVFTASNGKEYRLVLDFKNRDQYPNNISVSRNTYSGSVYISFKDNIVFDIYILNKVGKKAASLSQIWLYPVGSYINSQAPNILIQDGVTNQQKDIQNANSSSAYVRWYPKNGTKSDIANLKIGNTEITSFGDTRFYLGKTRVIYTLLPTEPEAPVLSAVSGKKPDKDGVINFVNSIDIQASINELDEGNGIELYGEEVETGSTKQQTGRHRRQQTGRQGYNKHSQ